PAAFSFHGARLGVPASMGERLHAPRRRGGSIALQRDAPARAGTPRDGLPGGVEGSGKGVLRALSPAAIRARWLRRGCAPNRLPDSSGRGRRLGGDLSEDRGLPPA